MKKLLLSVFSLLLTLNISMAQVPDIVWSQTFGGENDDVAHDIIQTSDGGFAICGITESKGHGGSDCIIIKLDAEGNVEWEQYYGDKGNESANSIIQTADNGYMICGYTDSKGRGKRDYYVVKTDSKGNAVWDAAYGGNKNDVANDIIETYDGYYAMVGSTKSRGAGGWDIWVIKIDNRGKRLWRKSQGGKSMDVGNSIAERPEDSSLIVCGTTYSEAMGQADLWLIKFSKEGKKIWRKRYGDIGKDSGNDFIIKEDGSYVLVGKTLAKSERYSDLWVVAFTKESWDDWEKSYGTVRDESAESVCETPDHGVVVCGYTSSYGEGSYDFWLMKFDKEGEQEWEQTYGGIKEDRAYSVIALSDNSFALCGFTKSDGDGRKDIWVVLLK